MRIVSLIASSTEIVCALGLGDFIVGKSHECDYPESIKPLPVCTGPKFEPDGTSYEIDQRVRAVLQEALSVYRVDADLLDRLQPTHIITQSQCEVCAVSLKDVEDAACKLISSEPQIISLEPNSLADIWQDIKRVSRALGVDERGAALIEALRTRMESVSHRCRELPSPRVAFIEWMDPLMAGGNWMPTLIRMAGGCNLFGIEDAHSPMVDWERMVEVDPEVMIVAPCGFDMARTWSEMDVMTGRPGWGGLSCVRGDRVFVADGNQYFNRPGPRVVESLEILAELIHPDSFAFGHEGTGWRRFDA